MADGCLLSVELVQDLEIILLGRMADHGGTVIYLDDIDPLYVLVIKPAPLCGALEQAVAVILQRPDYSLCVECSAAVYCVCPLVNYSVGRCGCAGWIQAVFAVEILDKSHAGFRVFQLWYAP